MSIGLHAQAGSSCNDSPAHTNSSGSSLARHTGVLRMAVLLLLGSVGLVHADSPALDKIPIVYASDGLKITGLLSKPAGDGPFPLIIVNHGGFEPAQHLGGLLDLFSKLGYVAVASDYRGIGHSEGHREVARGEVSDVLNAITYAQNQPYVDRKRVVMWGFSHGGTIALLAAARAPGIQAVVVVEGPVDLAASYRHWAKMSAASSASLAPKDIQRLVGSTPEENPDEWKARSPLFCADKIKCPVYLIYGANDAVVPVAEGVRMADALRAAGNPHVTMVIDPGAKHGLDGKAFGRVRQGMLNFLNEHAGRPSMP